MGSALAQEKLDPTQNAVSIPVPIEEQVVRRRRPVTDPYAALGIDTGGLRLFPSLEIGGIVTSNVRKAETSKQAAVGLRLKPSLGFASDWSRHSWTGNATGEWQAYNQGSDLSTLAGSVDSAFRLDIRHTTFADFSARYSLTDSGSSNSQVPNSAAESRRDQSFGVSADLNHDFGGIEGRVSTGLNRNIFSDVALVGGGTEVNADRNYWEPTLGLRGALNDPGAPFKPFVEITYAPRFHDQTLDRNGLKRDSHGISLSAGVSIDRGPLWTGEVAITDLLRSYADPALDTTNALGVAGRVTWRPTELTSITASSGVALGETSTAGVAATKTWNVDLNLTHALRDNIDLLAGTGFSIQNTGTTIDYTNTATLGVNWKVNPNMSAGVTYQGTWFRAGTAGEDYDEQRLLTSIILKD
jgi:hypothetical protein